jgi:hypothetical protein
MNNNIVCTYHEQYNRYNRGGKIGLTLSVDYTDINRFQAIILFSEYVSTVLGDDWEIKFVGNVYTDFTAREQVQSFTLIAKSVKAKVYLGLLS